MNLLTELNEDFNQDDIVPLCEALEEAVGMMNTRSRSGAIKSKLRGSADFFKKNPMVTIAAATMALDSYSKYKANKRNTIKLFAKDAYERKMMTSVVDALTKSSRFKVMKVKYANSGKIWVLKRV